MHSKSIVAIAAAISAAKASPVLRRQEDSTATIAVTETNTVETDAATSPGLTPTVSTGTAGGETYPLYPCPPNFLLTYAQVNATVNRPIDQVNEEVGAWADAIIFPNVTSTDSADGSDNNDGNAAGATHTFSVMDVSYSEVLVNTTQEGGSAYTQWVYNGTEPVTAGGLQISNYQTVYKAYDPTFSITQTRGPTTTVQLFTNACANMQDEARTALTALFQEQLSQIEGVTLATDGNGGQAITSVLDTMSLTATETNTAIATETETDIASDTVLGTETELNTQTNTIVPATASTTAATEQVTTTPATETETTTPVTQTATVTAVTEQVTAATDTITAGANGADATVVNTVATTTTSV